MRTVKIFFLWCSLFSNLVFSQPSKTNIAITEFKATGIDEAASGILGDKVRDELIKSGYFRIMERDQVEEVLKEQGFQQSGACEEQSCLVEIGQLLGVERIFSGSINRVEKYYSFSLRIIDVTSGEILFTFMEDAEGELKDILPLLAQKSVKKLLKKRGEISSSADIAGKRGSLHIDADEPGASIEIDGTVIEGKIPVTLDEFPAGGHEIVVRHTNKIGRKKIFLNPGELLKVNVEMREGLGHIKVFSTPDAIDVLIDKKNYGPTPLETELPVGEHTVRIEKTGFEPVEKSVTIQHNARVTEKFTLNPIKDFQKNKRKRQRIRRILFGTLTISACGAGVLFDVLAMNNLENRDKAATDYEKVKFSDGNEEEREKICKDLKNTYNSETENAELNILMRNISYGLGGAFGLGIIISIPF